MNNTLNLRPILVAQEYSQEYIDRLIARNIQIHQIHKTTRSRLTPSTRDRLSVMLSSSYPSPAAGEHVVWVSVGFTQEKVLGYISTYENKKRKTKEKYHEKKAGKKSDDASSSSLSEERYQGVPIPHRE